MYTPEKAKYISDNIYAGDFPVEIDVLDAKEEIGKNTVVALIAGKVAKLTNENLVDIYGITADEGKANEKIAVYLTGDFKASALNFNGVAKDKVKIALRKISIFVK